MENVIKVGMADLKASGHECIIATYGLGSCIGVALYDKKTKICGLAHIMLPSSKQSKNKSNTAKFVDTAIVRLVDEMSDLGAERKNIVAKIAGGSQMFPSLSFNEIASIGKANISSTKETLEQLGIPIIAEDTGGHYGRTLEFHSVDGNLHIKTMLYGIKQI